MNDQFLIRSRSMNKKTSIFFNNMLMLYLIIKTCIGKYQRFDSCFLIG